jgi:post-segregation antitoxin (ccd killing protein)
MAMNEHTLKENHSSKSEQTTRVKSRRKQAKTTVGITISPILLAETRKHKLNTSRITEQALSSILEYLQTQNESDSSKPLNTSSQFLTEGSFQKETSECRGLASQERLHRRFTIYIFQ